MKIDVSKIENYSSLTPEEKIAALEGFEIETENADVNKLKTALSKANSEAADFKKKLLEKMSEQEKAEAERAEREKAINDELEGYRKREQINTIRNEYITLGYSPEHADEAANAEVGGDRSKLFEVKKKHKEYLEAEFQKKLLEKQPGLSGTNGTTPPNLNDMSDEDYYKTLKK